MFFAYLIVGAILTLIFLVVPSLILPPPGGFIVQLLFFGAIIAWLMRLSDRLGRLEAWLAEVDPAGDKRRRKEEETDPLVATSERDRIKAKMDAYAKAHEEKRQGGN